MSILRAVARVLGFTVGVAAALGVATWLYRAARRLRAECPPEERPIYRDVLELVEDARSLWQRPEGLIGLYRSSLVVHPFSAKIALAALGDGACRAGTGLAYLFGMTRGLSVTEVRGLLEAGAAGATPGEAPAVAFARHYRLTEGMPDPAMVLALVETYGQDGANDLLSYLRLLLLVVRASRSVDCLAARLVGRPRSDSTLPGELSVIWVSVVALAPLHSLLRWRALHAAQPPARISGAPVADA